MRRGGAPSDGVVEHGYAPIIHIRNYPDMIVIVIITK
jgi:hypothetical protein